jgi:hypothetical protein
VVIALVLIAFSLDTGLSADDYIHRMIVQGSTELSGFAHEPLDLFHFASEGYTAKLMREGVLAFWEDPEAKLAFFRPISSLTHYVDYRFWPSQAWLMHLHSLAWSALLFAGLLALYRALVTPAWVCALCTMLYALDDARGWFGSWIATRNAIVATAISIWALVHYVRARSGGSGMNRFWAVVLFALSLLAGEGALSICGYLLGYALFLDRGSWRGRIVSLLPYAVVVVAWRLAYRGLGYGVQNSGLYFDPSVDPIGFLEHFAVRGPVLLFSQLGGFWSDVWTAIFFLPNFQRLIVWIALGAILAFGHALWPLLRSDPLTRFGTFGALLSLVPASAAFIADRLLTWVAIGGSLALGRLIACYLRDRDALGNDALRALVLPPLMLGLVFAKAVIEPVFLPSRARGNLVLRDNLDRASAGVPTAPSIRHKRVVYVNPAALPFVAYIPVERAALGVPRPQEQYWLATSESEVRIKRLDPRSLRVRQRGGYLLGPGSLLLRNPKRPFARGQRVALDGLTIEVSDVTPDGRPAEILATFDRELEHPSLLWLCWGDTGLLPCKPPRIGEQVTLPAADYFRASLGDAIRVPLDGRLPPPRDPSWDE